MDTLTVCFSLLFEEKLCVLGNNYVGLSECCTVVNLKDESEFFDPIQNETDMQVI